MFRNVYDVPHCTHNAGKDASNGGNETVRTRRIACVRFSTLQPHLLASAHLFPVDEQAAEMDMKPYKVIVCVVYALIT